MNSKERVLRAIEHEEVDRVPCYFLGGYKINLKLANKLGINSSKSDSYQPEFGCYKSGEAELGFYLGSDVRFICPERINKPERMFFDCGGVHAAIHNGTLVYNKMPLEDAKSIDDILNYDKWPNPDWFDYKIPLSTLPSLKDKAVCAYDMFILLLYAMGMRGMDALMMDMAADPEIAHAVFEKVSVFNLECIRRFLTINKGVIDIVGIGDDVAGQAGMFFSIDMWREYIKPHVQKAVDLCHDFNVIPYFHGCGGFSVLYDDFTEMGLRCTGRLQTEAKGNNFSTLKKEYGKDLCFWGAVDGQHILIEGTPDEVREHVKKLLAENYDGTGFIAGPTHSFTEDTPIKNILAVYDTLKNQ